MVATAGLAAVHVGFPNPPDLNPSERRLSLGRLVGFLIWFPPEPQVQRITRNARSFRGAATLLIFGANMLGMTSKAALRAQMKRKRAELAQAKPAAARELCQTYLYQIPPEAQVGPPKIVSAYWPIESEISPFPLIEMFAARGVRLALPRLEPKGEGYEMRFHEFQMGQRLSIGPFGIPQPDEKWAEIQPDIVIAPLLAFDAQGFRLGYGGGYYDRAIETMRELRLKTHKPLAVWGLAYDEQGLDVLPHEPHDQGLECVLTPKRVIFFG